MSQIPTIPEPKDLPELVRLLNDRLRRIGMEISARFRRGEDLDMQGFRIKNISQAIEATDAVSRVESDRRRLFGGAGGAQPGAGIEHFTARWTSESPAVGVDVAANHFYVSIPVDKKVTLERGIANTKAAVAGTFAADWQVSTDNKATWNSVFTSTTLEIAAGQTFGEQTDLAITTLNRGDYLRIDISSVGGAVDVECVLAGIIVDK